MDMKDRIKEIEEQCMNNGESSNYDYMVEVMISLDSLALQSWILFEVRELYALAYAKVTEEDMKTFLKVYRTIY